MGVAQGWVSGSERGSDGETGLGRDRREEVMERPYRVECLCGFGVIKKHNGGGERK